MPHIPTEIPPPSGLNNSTSANPVRSFDLMQMLIIVGIVRLSKTKEGIKVIRDLGKEFINGVFKTTGYLAQASSANKVSAWANPIMISGIMEHWGFLPSGFNTNYHLGLTVIAGAEMAEGFLDTIVGALPWTALKKPEPSEYPQVIHFASELRELGFSGSEVGEILKQTKK